MPRKVIIRKQEIWKRRQDNYSRYFSMHLLAIRQPPQLAQTIANATSDFTDLDLFGHLDTDKYRNALVILRNRIDLSQFDNPAFQGEDMFNPWIWSKDRWPQYVASFNALPDPSTDYEMKYNRETDTIHYVPLQTRTSDVQVEYNSSTSR